MSVEQLDVLIRNFQADSKKMKLLRILSQQLEQLVREGRADIHAFCNTLNEEKLVSEEEFRHLGAIFALDGVSRFPVTKGTPADQVKLHAGHLARRHPRSCREPVG
jgi:hypothetical protein